MPLLHHTSRRAGRNLACPRATDISRPVHESFPESSLRVRGAAHNQSRAARVSCTVRSPWLKSDGPGGLVNRNRRGMILGLALPALCLGLGAGLAAQNQAKAPATATPPPA